MPPPAVALLLILAFVSGCAHAPRPAPPLLLPAREVWVDLVAGEEISTSDLLDDLATAGAIYVGETHSIARHHRVQLELLQSLFARGVSLVLCLEQLEAADQPLVDRYARGEIDFATFARDSKWAEKWRNYADYAGLTEFARQHRIPIRALNAPAAVVRAVSRSGGVAGITPEQREQLPADLQVDDPTYERLMQIQLAVHAAVDPARLRPMFEAQMARDETMAANIVAARPAGTNPPRTAFVVLGAGHMRYGLGTPAGVRRRDPAIVERLILISESGELHLTAAEEAASREITISHADLRALRRPPADYLRLLPFSAMPALPPGHPPIPR